MKKYTKIAVWDFDGTLIDSPLPDKGKIEYEKKTGNPWPHAGWWGQADSLNLEVFEMPVIESVFNDYQKEKANDNTLMVLLTGRLSKLSDSVEKILNSKNLTFDEYHYNTGGSTDVVKITTLNTLIKNYPEVEIVELWEDRLEHVPIFEEWGKEQCLSGKLKDFKINVVFSGHH